MPKSKPKHKIVSVTIRFPEPLHAKLKDWAENESPPTPFNSLIVRLLYEALEPMDIVLEQRNIELEKENRLLTQRLIDALERKRK
jgi:hypothetical protein